MFMSHRFGSVETLVPRPIDWLTSLGFEVAPSDPDSHDRLSTQSEVGLAEASAALALIDSIEQIRSGGLARRL